jgi:hypothetical protein
MATHCASVYQPILLLSSHPSFYTHFPRRIRTSFIIYTISKHTIYLLVCLATYNVSVMVCLATYSVSVMVCLATYSVSVMVCLAINIQCICNGVPSNIQCICNGVLYLYWPVHHIFSPAVVYILIISTSLYQL